jgi:hypothetical protein
LARRWGPREPESDLLWMERWIDGYLSARHQLDASGGCVLPGLSVDVGRGSVATRRVYEQRVLEAVNTLQLSCSDCAGLSTREMAWGTLALLTGAVVLARAMRSKKVALELLQSCRGMAALTLPRRVGSIIPVVQPVVPTLKRRIARGGQTVPVLARDGGHPMRVTSRGREK